MNKFILTVLFFLTTGLAFTQTTVTFTALKDNTIYSDIPGNSNGVGGDITAGNNSGSGIRRALIKFDIASLVPAGAVITSVTLTLNCNKTRAGADNVSLYKLLNDWGEGASNAGSGGSGDGTGTTAESNDATWPCRNSDGGGGCDLSWGTSGGDFSASVSATTSVNSPGVNYTWSGAGMVADVQSWRNTPANNFGWIIRGDETTSTTAKRFGSRENPTVANRPKLSVTYTAPTPVTLSLFKVSEAKQGILLNWQTSSEFNNAWFNIEHSIDGITFITIGKIKGAGTSTLVHNYQFTHQGITEGKHFYRLGQTDVSGDVHYSPVASIISKEKHLQVSINPNPVKDVINLGGIAITPSVTYSIINSSGAIVKQGILQSNLIMADGLAKGFYMLRINRPGSETLSGLFLKQ